MCFFGGLLEETCVIKWQKKKQLLAQISQHQKKKKNKKNKNKNKIEIEIEIEIIKTWTMK